ncbi:SDR family oxidoreductase [Archangium minus]|uniref:SDR family oxidoreductase n=2 Tax=Archangium minus TaxID=83450 RepID=A0ABY9X835_9BACT|nr:SDR family oxidoreductase [Archangium minus]
MDRRREKHMAGKILIIGATGAVGRELLARLETSGEEVLAASRHPAGAASEVQTRARFVTFDLERPETFAPALDGVDRVFLIARPGDEHADRLALPLIDEMKRRGVRHVVNLSAMGAELRSGFALRKVELYLEDSGIGFTHLRPNWFMQVFSSGTLLAGLRATGEIRIPAGHAKISYIDVRDIASVAALALTEPGHRGKAYTLTGDEALDTTEVAQLLSHAAQRPLRYVPLSEDEARSTLRAAGFPDEWVERLIQFYRFVREGFCAPVSPDVRTVLGRPARTFAAFAREHASLWAAPSV